MAKRSSPGGQKRVTVENLVALGSERLAALLVGAAETRPDLKRRLRMELAAEQGASSLAPEIDKRLSSLETSRSRIGWRQRPAFTRDLDALRELIVEKLAPADASAAVDRLWRYIEAAGAVGSRFRQRGGELDRVFEDAAGELGRLLAASAPELAAARLADHLTAHPSAWRLWLPALLATTPLSVAEAALRLISQRKDAASSWIPLIRQLAEAAQDIDALRATYPHEQVKTPAVAADLARRYLAAGRIEDAGVTLRGAAPSPAVKRRVEPPTDFDWETQWIDYLERSGRLAEAQAVRWASFERTMAVERARAFVSRLADFDDVEAENRAFDLASSAADFQRGLQFLMNWPALAEAGRMIETRYEEINVEPEAAQVWAASLRLRQPKAAHRLLKQTAAAAFRRRDFKTCDRLMADAETIALS